MDPERELDQDDDSLLSALESAVDEFEEDPNDESQTEEAGQEEAGFKAERDESGRFAKKEEEANAGADEAEIPPEGGEAVPHVDDVSPDAGAVGSDPDSGGELKAPQSWTPTAREGWQNTPEAIKQEVIKREREINIAMQDSSDARRTQETVQGLAQRFAPALQAEGVDIGVATVNVLEFASKLRFGTENEKASAIANAINHYGIDINTLDQILSNPNAPRQQAPAQQAPQTDPRVEQLFSYLGNIEQERMGQTVNEVQTFVEAQEFGADVRGMMADILDVAAAQNLTMSLQQAYDRACLLDPGVSQVIEQRKGAGNVMSTDRARNAASSVKGTPVGQVGGGHDDSLRGALMDAVENQ